MPKCPAASGSFGAADELFDLGMVLPSGAGLHPGRDVDGEGPQRAHHLGHRVGAEAARHEQAGGGQPGRPSGVERDAGTARLAGDEAVEQEIVGRIARGEGGEIGARARADRLDRPPAPAPAVVGVFVAVELEHGEADPRRDLLDARARRVDEDVDQRRAGHRLRDPDRRRGGHVAVARETSKVARSRLLMPMSVAPSPAARSSSASLCTSTSTSRPPARAAASRSAPCLAVTPPTTSSTASAPKARASSIWYGSIKKSLRRQGSPEAARAEARCSSAPPKKGPSVSTE